MAVNYGESISDFAAGNTSQPLAMNMMQHMPGITASMGFSSMRGANTLIRGGFMDDAKAFSKYRSRFGVFQNGSLTPTAATRDSFLFGRKRSLTNKAGKLRDPFFKPSRLNNVTLRPRAATRMHSLSTFTAAENSGLYTFAQGHRMLNKLPMKGLRQAIGASPEASIFGPGMISAVSAGRKLDRLGSAANLDRLSLNVQRLATANNPALLQKVGGTSYQQAMNMSLRSRGGLSATEYAAANLGTSTFETSMAAARSGERGVAGNLLASSMRGEGTRYLAGYFRGAQGFASAAGLEGKSLAGATKAVGHLTTALQAQGLERSGAMVANRALQEGVIKTLGVKRTAQALTTSAGAKVLGARAAALAIPGLQFVAAASLVYDLGKMAGEVVKSGIELARDANYSLQGSINKPMFGMGYRDTELAATSRARGVMAIQNSRLNARSSLGSEASMMAAHFG